jgi:uncharacterized membrane protein
MTTLIMGLVLFLAIHSTSIVAPGWRDRTAVRIGANAWRGVYSLLSLAGLLLIIHGFSLARAEPIVLYTPGPGLHQAARLLMLPVFPMLLAASWPGRIKSALKHPMLAAVKLWAVAHLLANGNLADVLLFGSFLAWAVLDRISFKGRTQRPQRTAPPGRWNDLIVVVAGLALYGVTVGWAHLRLFGVSPMG